jgi:S-adenosylmethionine hydrolase
MGTVVELDHFGNLGTNLPPEATRDAGELEVGDRRIPFCRTYGDVGPGELLALLDSAGRVEIAVRDGSAAERLGLGVGSPVRVRVGREEGE